MPDDPTAHYSYEEAVTNNPPYLSSPQASIFTTNFFSREGIKYSTINKNKQLELEEQVSDPETIDYVLLEIDKYIYNKNTNRQKIRNLMENGMRLHDGSLGKTIIFARNHRHATILQDAFDELYPQMGGNSAR